MRIVKNRGGCAIHDKSESLQPKHLKYRSAKPKILRWLIAIELMAVVLACGVVYRIWYHGVEMSYFTRFRESAAENASGHIYAQTAVALKTYMEGLAEEVYEYAWTTEEVEYRTGADMSYKAAGTFDKDKFVRHTGIMNNGWDRVAVDGEDYYIPGGELSTDVPEGLPIAAGIKGEYQKYALSLLPDFGWDDSELEPLIYLWNRESGWNPRSHNKSSGAHGIPQALPGSKMASEGSDYYTNPEPQIRWGLKYVAGRYGSPSAAWRHFQSHGWY